MKDAKYSIPQMGMIIWGAVAKFINFSDLIWSAFYAPFIHNFFKVTIRNTITEIEKYSIENDIFWKVSAFNANYRIFQFLKLACNRMAANWIIFAKTGKFSTLFDTMEYPNR